MTIRLYSTSSSDPASGVEINVQTMQKFLHGKMITKLELPTNQLQAKIFFADGSLIEIAAIADIGINFIKKGDDPATTWTG